MTKFLLLAAVAVAIIFVSGLLRAGETPSVGTEAPGFRLQDQDGKWHDLSDYRGQWLAVYFYPKDDTPGCTTEACNFRDNHFAFEAIGAKIVGISVDSVESHKAFAEKYQLPFTILADEAGTVAKAYGVLKDFKLVKLASRQSFIVDPEGHVAKHYAEVDPETHTQQVLADLEALMRQDA
ncbi:MAG: peroxiredoxin [Xanthomonadales bacterium]|nr:peroxiredoxin [Xanthomonadales bacterium]